MKLEVYNSLRKIAAGFTPDPTLVTDVLGYTETDFNPYDPNHNLDNHYIRTRIRGTWGDPNIPREKWSSSSAHNPWQINQDRSTDIAKYDPEYAKLHNTVLSPLYNEMLRTGLGKYQYKQYLATGKLPAGFKGKYNASADYGGMPRKFSAAEHNVIRNGVRNYVSKSMIPRAMKIANGDENKFWYTVAALHHLGHAVPENDEERGQMSAYMKMLTPKIKRMRDARAATQARVKELDAQFEALRPASSRGVPNRVQRANQILRERAKFKQLLW